MFTLSQTTGYAIKALACIAAESGASQIRDIAERTEISVSYLAKVIHRLGSGGLVESRRGNKGGIWLAREADEITLLQISEAVDGESQFTSCILGLDACSDARACPAHEFWKSVRISIRQKLESTTLADVVAFEARRTAREAERALSDARPPTLPGLSSV